MALWSCTQSKRLFYMLFPPPDIWHNSDVWTTFCNPIIFASFRGDVARRGIAHCCCQLLLLSTLPSFFSRFEKSSKTILSSIFLFLDWWWIDEVINMTINGKIASYICHACKNQQYKWKVSRKTKTQRNYTWYIQSISGLCT